MTPFFVCQFSVKRQQLAADFFSFKLIFTRTLRANWNSSQKTTNYILLNYEPFVRPLGLPSDKFLCHQQQVIKIFVMLFHTFLTVRRHLLCHDAQSVMQVRFVIFARLDNCLIAWHTRKCQDFQELDAYQRWPLAIIAPRVKLNSPSQCGDCHTCAHIFEFSVSWPIVCVLTSLALSTIKTRRTQLEASASPKIALCSRCASANLSTIQTKKSEIATFGACWRLVSLSTETLAGLKERQAYFWTVMYFSCAEIAHNEFGDGQIGWAHN